MWVKMTTLFLQCSNCGLYGIDSAITGYFPNHSETYASVEHTCTGSGIPGLDRDIPLDKQ